MLKAQLMKKGSGIFSLLLPAIFCSILLNSASAQDSLFVTESVMMMSQGKQNGFSILIPIIRAKDGEKIWKKFISTETKSSLRKEDNELVLQHAVIKTMGSDTFNVYVFFAAKEEGTFLYSFFSGTDSVFISSNKHEALSNSSKILLHNFAVIAYKEGVSEQLKDENDKLEKLEGELKEIDKNNSNLENQIKKNNREIDRTKKEIETLEKQEEFATSEVLKQKQLLTTFVGSKESRDIESKKLKDMEKEKKKIIKDIENSNRKIDHIEDEIKSAEKSIDKNNNTLIPDKQQEISNQKQVIKQVDTLLQNIH